MYGSVAPLLVLALGVIHGPPRAFLFADAVMTSTPTTTASGASAMVHLLEYATYDTSSSLGPWAPAELNEAWDAVDDGSDPLEPVWCIQNNPITADADADDMVGQPDRCLQLRVFEPTQADDAAPLPVMLWIHGGIYLLGSGVAEDFYNGARLATNEGVVVVAINYRLGPHGFLGYEGDYGETSNAGIMDQKVAIEWTSRYIERFGGDPEKITVAGESAGATSAAIHMANRETNALFRGAILESNPGGINLKTTKDQQDLFRKLAKKKLGCSRWGGDEKLMDCLVELSRTEGGMAKIIQESKKVTYINSILKPDIWMSFYTWAPSIGGGYITGQPNKEALAAWPSAKPLLIGTNEDEGRFFIETVCTILESTGLLKCGGSDMYDGLLFDSMVRIGYGSRDASQIKKYYKFQKESTDAQNSPLSAFDDAPEQFANLVTDSLFTCPNYDMAMGIADARLDNTFFYRYAVDAICTVASDKSDCEGFSCHGDEIATVFGTYYEPAVAAQSDCTPAKVAQLQPFVYVLQSQWGHFIREGFPDSSGTAGAVATVASGPWNHASRDAGMAFTFGQESDESGAVRPTAVEAPFTTHHSEKADYTALEVCQFWKTHTDRSENGGAGSADMLSSY